MSGTVGKIAAERNQKALMELAMRPGNGKRCLNPIGVFYSPVVRRRSQVETQVIAS